MTISELQIQFDLNKGNEHALLEEHASWADYGYLFVDSENGQCWLFDRNGKLDDIKKIDAIYARYVKKDIKKIVIPNGVESIGDAAFARCTSLTSIEIPENVKNIGRGTFASCTSLTSIEIPNSIKNIGDFVFEDCTSLKNIDIPESVESIRDYAFWNCKSLTSIKIPISVKNIGNEAFYNCRSLKNIIFKDKIIGQVKKMNDYPWGIKDESIIKCQKS